MSRQSLRCVVSVIALSLAATVVAAPAARLEAGDPPAARVRELAGRRGSLVPGIHGTQISGVLSGERYFPQSIASGDPRPDSVIIWTRLADADRAGTDLPVRLIVTKDRYFAHVVYNQVVTAKSAYDHCVKVRVGGLEPGTSYIYFFVYEKGGTLYLSHTGFTKTAPAPDSEVPVRFAFLNCQDYVGRYYNVLQKALLDHSSDIDFVVHLGDYVYETTGDPSFQAPPADRELVFADQAGAIRLGDDEHPYYAANSLSNYRDLYKTYRSDEMLQKIHERYPMIATWDDHEYTNDSHGAEGTYFAGRRDENDPVRRRNADRAYLEFMPIEVGLDAGGTLTVDDSMIFPNTRIYRTFRFGTNVELVMTDFRSFRPDHLVPEDAFPGKLAISREVIELVVGPAGYQLFASQLDPYVDLDGFPAVMAPMLAIVTQMYLTENPELSQADAAALAGEALAGRVSATFVNAAFAAASLPSPFDDAALAAMDRGLTVLMFGKRSIYSAAGSRNFVVKDSLDMYSSFGFFSTGGETQNAYGATQEAWLRDTLTESPATWKLLGSSVAYAPKILDFTNPAIAAVLPPTFPDLLRRTFLFGADDWDGFPDKRSSLMQFYATVPNLVILSGDWHASFVTDHRNGVFEFTGPAVSSETAQGEALKFVLGDPLLSQVPGVEQIVGLLGTIVQISSLDPEVSPAQLAFSDTSRNGYVFVEVTPDALQATYSLIDGDETLTSYYATPDALPSLFTTTTFTLSGGGLSISAP